MKPMKLTDVGTNVEPYLHDRNYVMQQKFDGARMLVIYRGGEILFTNDGVQPIKFAAAKLHLPALETALLDWFEDSLVHTAVIDGELMVDTGTYMMFDLVEMETHPDSGRPALPSGQPLFERLAALRSLAGGLPLRWQVAQLAWTAQTTGEKRALWDTVNTTGVEGAVSKRLDSVWTPGIRTADWVKHKLVKSADVVVTSVERTFKANGVVSHGKAELAVPISPNDDPMPFVNAKGKRIDKAEMSSLEGRGKSWAFDYVPRDLLPVGNASLIGKDLAIEVGSVVEVDYLYWTGDAMIQPRIVRLREDKLPDECDLAQFPAYSRAAVEPGTAGLPDDETLNRMALSQPPAEAAAMLARAVATVKRADQPAADGPRSGRGPSGKLRNFDAMNDAKFEKEAAKVEAEGNDPEALAAVRASREARS